MTTYHQLDIYWVDLNPTRGAETFKTRPCVILQSDMMNLDSRTLVVAPLLPNHRNWPFAVNLIPSKGNGLDGNRYLNLKQLRVVDVSRLGKKQGALEPHYLPAIHESLQTIFGII